MAVILVSFIPCASCVPCPVFPFAVFLPYLLLPPFALGSAFPACSLRISIWSSFFQRAFPDHLPYLHPSHAPRHLSETVIALRAPHAFFRRCFTASILHLFVSLLSSCLCFITRLWTVWGQETCLLCLPLSGHSRLNMYLWDRWIFGTYGWVNGQISLPLFCYGLLVCFQTARPSPSRWILIAYSQFHQRVLSKGPHSWFNAPHLTHLP